MEIKCPLCCKGRFNSFSDLKNHILDVTRILTCPGCSGNFTEFNLFILHLDECTQEKLETSNCLLKSEVIENNTSQEIEPNSPMNSDNDISGASHDDKEFYCEICDMYFSEMKAHLMEYHMGQEIIVESQDLDKVLKESEIDIEHRSNVETNLDTKPLLGSSNLENLSDEEEVLNEKGNVSMEKFTEINTSQTSSAIKQPIMENIVFSNGDTSIEGKSDSGNVMRTYRCPNCDSRFPHYINYSKHDCDVKQGNICEICSITFSTKGALTYHKRKIHNEAKHKEKIPSECNICHIVFPSSKSMFLHRKMHDPIVKTRSIDPPVTYNIIGLTICEENTEMFTCNLCGKEYNKKYEEVHMKSHVEEMFNCEICNRKFTDKNDLVMHAQAHKNEVEKNVACKYCEKNFMCGESLTDHAQNHCEARKYSCSYCGRKFLKPNEKVKHERIHTGHKPHVCEVCGRSFRVSYCLTLHMRTHSGVRPYHCETCGKRFKSHSVFNHHMQTHSDLRPYKCPFCPKAFKTIVQLAGHKNTHTKPFSCNVCNRPFASLYAVRIHTKSHERQNNLNHQCHICGAVYARNFALRDHLLSHPKQPENDSNTNCETKEKTKIDNHDTKTNALNETASVDDGGIHDMEYSNATM